jgi:hypothetical protein
MKVVVTENEVNRVPVDAVSLSLQKLPYDGQDEQDQMLAKIFLYKKIGKQVNGPLDKLEDKIKKAYRDGGKKVILSKNYRLECIEGSPRQLFDFDTFAKLITEKYPEVETFVLRELYGKAKALSTAPVSIEIEYIGDTRR